MNYDAEKNILLYDKGDLAPKGYISYTHAIFGAVLFLILLYSLIMQKMANILTARQAKKILYDELIFMRDKLNRPEFQGRIRVGEAFKLRQYQDMSNNFLPHEWLVSVVLGDLSRGEPERYYIGTVIPSGEMMGYVTGLMRRDSMFSGEDICPDCGKFYNFKYIDSIEVKKEKAFRTSLWGLTRRR